MSEPGTQEEEQTKVETNFIFRGGALALDLVNTEIMQRGKRKDLLSVPEDLASWWKATLEHYPEVASIALNFDEALLREVKRLRESLRGLFSKLAQQTEVTEDDLTELNGVLKLGYQTVELKPGGKFQAAYLPHKPEATLLLPLALSAFDLLTGSEQKRLHKCKNDRCILFFYDNTKSATRHWCSQDCMNRARSIQHYRQQKEARGV